VIEEIIEEVEDQEVEAIQEVKVTQEAGNFDIDEIVYLF
jgi:hypothetical protein